MRLALKVVTQNDSDFVDINLLYIHRVKHRTVCCGRTGKKCDSIFYTNVSCRVPKGRQQNFVRIKKLARHTTKPVINGVAWLMTMAGKIHHAY